MSKTTKIIAALGVVAGLGVAALPAFTYATETVTGSVEVDVEVLPAIAMTISGNNDNGEHYQPSTAKYVYAEATPVSNPQAEGLYEEDSEPGEYKLSADTTVVSGKTYYKRTSDTFNPTDDFNPVGIASGTLDGHTIPGSRIQSLSSSYISLLPNGIEEGDATNGFRSTITVYTNAAAGYTLSVNDADSDTDLKNGAIGIPTQGSALSRGTAGWNFDVIRHGAMEGEPGEQTFVPTEDGTTMEVSNQAISATATPIDNYTAKTSDGRDTIVDYNVATNADQATGIYKDTIVYTATTN